MTPKQFCWGGGQSWGKQPSSSSAAEGESRHREPERWEPGGLAGGRTGPPGAT